MRYQLFYSSLIKVRKNSHFNNTRILADHSIGEQKVKKKPFYSIKTRIMTEEIKHEVKGLEDLSEAEITDDDRMKTVALRVRDFTDAKGKSKDAKGESKDAKGKSKDAKDEGKDAKGKVAKDENAERSRSVVFNAYNLALHSEVFCDALSMTFPYEAQFAAPCIDNIDFSAIPDDPYTDERSIITVPVGNPNSPVSVDSLKFLAKFVNATEPVEEDPVRKKFKWFPPSSYMEVIYQGYETIPELMKYLQDANLLGFHSLTYFLASEVAEQLRMYASGRKLTRDEVEAFERGEVWTPNHDTRRRTLMLEDQRSDRVVNAILEEMRRSEGKRA